MSRGVNVHVSSVRWFVPGAYLRPLCVLFFSCFCQWRYNETFPPTIARGDYLEWELYWWWLFFSAEFFLAIAVWVGLAQRLFPVQRIKVTMDDITAVDDQVGYNAR